MKEALLAGRYARALAESVPDPQALEQAGAAVAALRDLRAGDPVFRAALEKALPDVFTAILRNPVSYSSTPPSNAPSNSRATTRARAARPTPGGPISRIGACSKAGAARLNWRA